MGRQSLITQKKKRGPPATGKGELLGVRMQPPQLAALDAWIVAQADAPSRPEAIRRLVEKALRPTDIRPVSAKAQEKAADLASKEIDKLKARDVDGEEHHQRKRHLIKGPKEFRELRSRRGNKPIE